MKLSIIFIIYVRRRTIYSITYYVLTLLDKFTGLFTTAKYHTVDSTIYLTFGLNVGLQREIYTFFVNKMYNSIS